MFTLPLKTSLQQNYCYISPLEGCIIVGRRIVIRGQSQTARGMGSLFVRRFSRGTFVCVTCQLVLVVYLLRFAILFKVARGSTTPLACLHKVIRDVISDSKVRQRDSLVGILKKVAVPSMRARALPVFKDLLGSSVTQKPDFFVMPPPAQREITAGSGAPAPAVGPASSAGQPKLIPAAIHVRTNKKAQLEVNEALRAQPIGDIFIDTDWLLDEALDDTAEALVLQLAETRIASMLHRLDKLPGKLMLY